MRLENKRRRLRLKEDKIWEDDAGRLVVSYKFPHFRVQSHSQAKKP